MRIVEGSTADNAGVLVKTVVHAGVADNAFVVLKILPASSAIQTMLGFVGWTARAP